MGLLCRATGIHDLPAGVAPFACESGRVGFDEGDFYNTGLTLAGAARREVDIGRFGEQLGHIGTRPHAPDEAQPTLAGNFEVVAVEGLAPPDLEREVDKLRGAESLTLRFLSPLRLERPPALKSRGAGFLNSDCFPPEHFINRLAYRLFLLAHDRYPEARERDDLQRLLSPASEIESRHENLWWLDIPLDGAPGRHDLQPKGYTIGGVVGKVVFKRVPESWLLPLVAGQYVHAGEKTHYGLGRYVIEECNGQGADPFRPARTAFERLLDSTVLQEALSHVAEHSTAPGVDGYTPDEIADGGERLAEQTVTELRAGKYRPSPLLGFVSPKENGSVRPLAIPTVRDRMVQRAACSLLSPAIETLLEDCSYAYRKGFSRAGAVRAIEKAYGEDYRYVLDADIESFFDAVEWERLFAKLEALFPSEPLLTLVKEWVRSPVVFQEAVIRRERGLPQGAAVSPLLANLYLDEFDEELLGRDYRLVRYGDDFVVLCKDMETAQRAREDARDKLAAMSLTLSEEKTAIRSFDEGFTYLGYLFCRSLIMESEREAQQLTVDVTREAVPAMSWLAQVPFERVRALIQRRAAGRRQSSVKAVELNRSGEVESLGTLIPRPLSEPSRPAKSALYVTSLDTTIRREEESLLVCAPEQEVPLRIPIRSLSHVVCYGRARMTLPVLLALSDEGVPTYICRWSGELRGVFASPPQDWQVWMAQAKMAGDEAARVEFARDVVAAKLHNFAALAVRFKLAGAAGVAEELRELEQSCVNKTTLDALNGLEGRGAALYFGAMGETLAEEWNFGGRRTQPPPDPVNAMLSFGYTLLYHHLSTALLVVGLNPRIGLYHTERGAYHALACDVQEEFRHMVDAQVWAMINRREVKPTDFYASEDGRYPFLMRHELRKKFIAGFERRLSSEFTLPDGAATTYRALMESQAQQIKELVTGRQPRYEPWRTRSK